MAQRIQLRNDISTNWSSVNPILMIGEVGLETDTGKYKIGDGVGTWSTLFYRRGGETALDITYNNTTSELQAINVQDAIDEIRTQINSLDAKVIAESGSNENGNYVKFKDGTMICFKFLHINSTFTVGTYTNLWTFPATFISSPVVNLTPSYQSANNDASKLDYFTYEIFTGIIPTSLTTNFKFSADLSYSFRCSMFAIGRWK